jgi:hypothetical protein
LQVLATDIDNRALETARRGAYAAAIHHSVSSTRLQRFFIRTEDGYKVKKALRETVMFAPQNLVNDPPFSHLDLVSCRNLLIYMQPELQRRVLETRISLCRYLNGHASFAASDRRGSPCACRGLCSPPLQGEPRRPKPAHSARNTAGWSETPFWSASSLQLY